MSRPNRHRVAVTQWRGPETDRDAPVSLEPGVRLGRYRLLERRGAGGMGVVFSAHDDHLDRRVALKLLRDGVVWESRGDRAARLIREARAMAKLDHPNIVGVHDVGVLHGHVYVSMDLVEGRTLAQWIPEHRSDWRAIVRAFVQAGRGLAAAHAAGVVHRDFKPENVLVGRDARVRVTDFGLARTMGGDGESGGGAGEWSPDEPSTPVDDDRLTDPAFAMGTVPYMAPEQGIEAQTDPRSDQFSFCVALYEALWGQRPFRGRRRERQLEEIRRGRIRRVPTSPRVPMAIRHAVFRGLSVEPDARWPSMHALVEALRRASGQGWVRSSSVRTRWAVAIVLVGLGSSSSWMALAHRDGEACERSPMDASWNAHRRSEVREAFARAAPDQAQRWMDVDRELDDYARGWTSAWTRTCLDEEPKPSRVGCSVASLAQFEASVRMLVIDGPPSDGALTLLDSSGTVADCGKSTDFDGSRQPEFERAVALWSAISSFERVALSLPPRRAIAEATALERRARRDGSPEALRRVEGIRRRIARRASGFESMTSATASEVSSAPWRRSGS